VWCHSGQVRDIPSRRCRGDHCAVAQRDEEVLRFCDWCWLPVLLLGGEHFAYLPPAADVSLNTDLQHIVELRLLTEEDEEEAAVVVVVVGKKDAQLFEKALTNPSLQAAASHTRPSQRSFHSPNSTHEPMNGVIKKVVRCAKAPEADDEDTYVEWW